MWDLADLGVPHDRVRRADQPLRYGRPRPRRPRLHHLAPPDPALPAFERIQKLVQGSVQHREGRIVQQPADAIVEEIFRTLRDEGWLDHLRPGGGRGAEGEATVGAAGPARPRTRRPPVIPLEYRLRDSVRLEPTTDGTCRVVSELPLSVVTVNAAAARLLEQTRHGASIADIAAGLRTAEERVFTLCEYFRGRGILEVGRTAADPDFAPSVTVIVPTRDRAADLDDCLRALAHLDYPRDRLEVIVVDDGSADPAAVAGAVARHGGRLLANERNRGPSYSRNRAAREAAGEILAFVDSDCVAGPGWLRELTPYFSWERVGAVGGRTTGYYTESRLDRYEEVASPLDMGTRLLLEARGTDTFYVPTCNLLVRRSVYQDMGGLREDLLVGEDVDLCWRLRARGAYLVYAPEGTVRHKHRNRLGAMLRRRADYGTSEATLHALHPDKRKRFPLAPAPLATVAILSAAVIGLEPRLLPVCLAPPLWDGARRALHLRRKGIDLPAGACGSPCSAVTSPCSTSCTSTSCGTTSRRWPQPVSSPRASGCSPPSPSCTPRPSTTPPGGLASATPRTSGTTWRSTPRTRVASSAGCVRSRTFRSYLPGDPAEPLLAVGSERRGSSCACCCSPASLVAARPPSSWSWRSGPPPRVCASA